MVLTPAMWKVRAKTSMSDSARNTIPAMRVATIDSIPGSRRHVRTAARRPPCLPWSLPCITLAMSCSCQIRTDLSFLPPALPLWDCRLAPLPQRNLAMARLFCGHVMRPLARATKLSETLRVLLNRLTAWSLTAQWTNRSTPPVTQ